MPETPWEELLHLSKSQLTTYLECSQRYQYQYVLSVPWEVMPAPLLFGKAMHRAVALYYQRKQAGLDVTLEDLEAIFHLAWDQGKSNLPLRFTRGATEDTLRAQGRELLRCFTAQVKPWRIDAVEKPFVVDLVDPDTGVILPVKLVGVIDLLESDDEGNVIVTELKTSARKYTEQQGEHQLDGAVYAYAVQQLGVSPTPEQVLIRFDVLVKTKTPQFEQYYFTKDATDFRKFLRLATKVVRAIALDVFVPHEGWYCATCPFLKRCTQDQRR